MATNGGMTPRKTRRQGMNPVPIGAVTRSDSMKQGSFQNRSSEPPMAIDATMHQGKKNRPGTIAPGKVPRMNSSMHQ